MFERNFVKRICQGFLIAIAICLSIAISQPSLAQGDFKFRADIISLQSRIGRLEQEVSRLRSSNSRASNSTAPIKSPANTPNSNITIVSPPEVDGQIIGRSDPLYERFATLLIELKEDVKNLDRRLTEIEDKASS